MYKLIKPEKPTSGLSNWWIYKAKPSDTLVMSKELSYDTINFWEALAEEPMPFLTQGSSHTM